MAFFYLYDLQEIWISYGVLQLSESSRMFCVDVTRVSHAVIRRFFILYRFLGIGIWMQDGSWLHKTKEGETIVGRQVEL